MTNFADKQLCCRDCKETFNFSAAEQEFFQDKGLTNEPKRCPNCRLLSRAQRLGLTAEQTTEVSCSSCGNATRVPFRPNGHKPVLCNVCFHNKKLEHEAQPTPINRERPLAVAT